MGNAAERRHHERLNRSERGSPIAEPKKPCIIGSIKVDRCPISSPQILLGHHFDGLFQGQRPGGARFPDCSGRAPGLRYGII